MQHTIIFIVLEIDAPAAKLWLIPYQNGNGQRKKPTEAKRTKGEKGRRAKKAALLKLKFLMELNDVSIFGFDMISLLQNCFWTFLARHMIDAFLWLDYSTVIFISVVVFVTTHIFLLYNQNNLLL